MGAIEQVETPLRRGLRWIERTDGATLYHVVFGSARPWRTQPRLSFADIDAAERGERRWPGWVVSVLVHVALIAAFWVPGERPLPPEGSRQQGLAVDLVVEKGASARAALRSAPMPGKVEASVPREATAPAIAPGTAGELSAPPAVTPVTVTKTAVAPDIAQSAIAEARAAPLAAAPAIQGARTKSNDEEAWEGAILSRITAKKRYPRRALAAGTEDIVMVRLLLDRRGALVRAELVRSRGDAALDREVLALARRASPFPRPPTSVAGETIALLVPVEFVITQRR